MTYQRISPAGIFIDADSSTYQRLPVDGAAVGEIPSTESLSSCNLVTPPVLGRRQPTGLLAVDRANPITRNLVGLISATNVTADVASGQRLTRYTGYPTSGKYGLAYTADNFSTVALGTGDHIRPEHKGGRTLFALARLPATADGSRLASLDSGSSSQWIIDSNSATGKIYSTYVASWNGYETDLERQVDWQSGDVLITATLYNLKSYVHVGTAIDTVGTSYVIGNLDWIPSPRPNLDFLPLVIGSAQPAIYMAGYFNRGLSPAEHLSLNANPWQLFRQEPVRRYFYPRTIPSGPITPTRPVGIITSKNRYGPPKRVPDINWSSPFADYLRAAVCISNDTAVEVLRGLPFSRVNTYPKAAATSNSKYGATRFVTNTNTLSNVLLCNTGPLMRSAASSFATATLAYREAQPDFSDISVVGFSYTSTSTIYLSISNSSNDAPQINLLGTGPVGYSRRALAPYVAKVPIFFGGYRSGTSLDMYVNGGVSNGTGSTGANALFGIPNTIYITDRGNVADPLDGGVAFAVLAEGVTDAAPFFKALNENPWQIFRERVPRLYSVSGLSPGSASVSEEGFFATASLGSETVSATRNPLITLSGLLGTTYLGNEQINRSTTVLSGYHQATMSLGDETIDIASQAFKAFWAHYANTVIKTRL